MSQKLKGTLTFIVKVCSLAQTHADMCNHSGSRHQIFSDPQEDWLFIYLFIYFASTEWGLLNSWETGLQTALYLHLVPNHNSMLQVGVLVSLEYQSPQRFSLGQQSPTLLTNCIHANLCVFCLSSDAFAKLLESGDLKSSSIRLEGVDMPFHHVLARICFHHHFSGTQGNLWTSYLFKRIISIMRVAFLYFCNVKPSDHRCAFLPFLHWHSCGKDRLLLLHVQQVYPGSPCLSAGQNCEWT